MRSVVTGDDGRVAGVELDDGTRIDADAIAIGPRFRARVDALAGLGLTTTAHASGMGDVLPVDELGLTEVPGVYAAGNVTDPGLQLLHAAGAGSRVGAMVSFDLAREDLEAAVRPSANEADWDHRYAGERMWSGNPNGSLVAEAEGLAPGRALDVGAGEGGDALWLAEHGWDVVASDVSGRALSGVAAEAEQRGVSLTCHRTDANARRLRGGGLRPGVGPVRLDTPHARWSRVANLIDAVAPGGTLVVVGHDLAPMRQPIDTATASRGFDPDAFVRVDDVAAALADAPGWEIEVHEHRPRPAGAASSHHVDDVVLRARRSAR